MADFGQQVTNTGINYGIGRLGDALGLPVPLPNFQEIRSVAGGRTGQAAGHYVRRVTAGLLDRALWANPIAGAANLIWRGAGALTNHPNWGFGNMLTHLVLDRNNPTGTVGGQPAVVDETGAHAGGMTIDPWTG